MLMKKRTVPIILIDGMMINWYYDREKIVIELTEMSLYINVLDVLLAC